MWITSTTEPCSPGIRKYAQPTITVSFIPKVPAQSFSQRKWGIVCLAAVTSPSLCHRPREWGCYVAPDYSLIPSKNSVLSYHKNIPWHLYDFLEYPSLQPGLCSVIQVIPFHFLLLTFCPVAHFLCFFSCLFSTHPAIYHLFLHNCLLFYVTQFQL